ncbi:hypothetical protein DMC30DRAFT_420285 [Rhodotorula diobovata]|uniref:Reverse transcriptase n=1 Tax=Rhodotorula diobovata TaxID=5288 RepID=A0A5C5FJP5_9BASI|nr:hypothetical protein DMC30DRAFT_420285 [Rhodotorula diobovata]
MDKKSLWAAVKKAAAGRTAWDILAPHLVPLYAASLALSHLPRSWRDCTGVVLRKPKKPDYSEKKAYRLIAFEQCVAKVLEAVVARRLSHLGKRGLWPVEHRHGNIVVGVALNVAKAFP